jgi:Tfp pilus assembly protein PilN
MGLHRTRFAVVLIGDRLCAAVVQGSRVETFVVESEQPATALRAELDARKVSPGGVAVGLPRTAVTVKPIDLPAVGSDTREMVQFELERHLPFPTEDAPFDFVPLAAPEDAEKTETLGRRVLLAACDRRVVDTAMRMMNEAKVRPVSITVAAHDLVALAKPPARSNVVWVHRTDETADLLFVARGTIVMSRSLPGGDDAALAAEVRRSFGLVKWRGCDEVWVSGDGITPDGLGGSSLADLGVPVTPPPYTLAARRALGAIDGGPRGALELALAVALAPAVRPLDLLPPALRPFRLTRAQLVTAGVAAAAVVLAIAALMVPGYRDGRRLAALNADIAGLDGEVRNVERLLKELDGKRRLVGTVDGLEQGSLRPLPVMRELTDLLPNDAWVTLLSLDAKGVELTGQASAASALIPLLENSARFERVEFASPVTRGRDREQFRIQAAWESRAGAAPRVAAAPTATQIAPPPPSVSRRPPAPGATVPGAAGLPPGSAVPPVATAPSPAPAPAPPIATAPPTTGPPVTATPPATTAPPPVGAPPAAGAPPVTATPPVAGAPPTRVRPQIATPPAATAPAPAAVESAETITPAPGANPGPGMRPSRRPVPPEGQR